MWKLNEIYAQNICAFRELHYTLRQGVTTLIFGDNRDNESQRSNGSGKSALIECIALGIAGSALRKIKNEEIINDHSEECLTRLCFENESCRELFTIERRIFRRGSATVVCTIERDGKPVETDEAVQPSVDAYNKYILEKLGITRDELFNNFILSKYKYEDFLSSPDKEKKEIINRFSNGILVDRAIEKIQEDKTPVREAFNKTEMELAGLDGRMDMLDEQIRQEENSKEEKIRTQAEKIESIETTITEKRSLIRQKKEDIATLGKEEDQLKTADDKLQELENGELSLECILKEIEQTLIPSVSGKRTDWNGVIVRKKGQIAKAEMDLAQWDDSVIQAEKMLQDTKAAYSRLQEEYTAFGPDYNKKDTALGNQLDRLKKQLDNASLETEGLKRTRKQLSVAIDNLNNCLAGTIACPACGHEFIVSKKDFDVTAGRTELAQKREELTSVSTKITDSDTAMDTLESEVDTVKADRKKLASLKLEWTDKLTAGERNLKCVSLGTDEVKENRKRVSDSIQTLQGEIETIRRKVFDEAFELMDEAYRSYERKKASLLEDIRTAESSIETLEDTIKELRKNTTTDILATLKASLKEYRKKSSAIMEKKTGIEKELGILEEQEQHFIRFKTYLANTKIEALSKITNEFLENTGSDIRIQFSGYTVLKTGKVREKISVSLIRAGLDCGSFGKFSAGEAARVNLATILSMQKLINSNCDADKGLDLLVLDEILEAVDEEGLAHTFNALNRLGVTAWVVSHGNIAEGYPHKLKIIKENGESKIEQ
jgi:exonuclease SbcC